MKKLLLPIIMGVLILNACSKETNENFDHFFLRTDGADLSVEVNGNIGSDVFLIYLHGGPGGGSYPYNFGYFAEEFEKDYAIVYLDQRGNGASQGSYDKSALTLDQNSKDIAELINFLKARYGQEISLFLAGHSWGGMTTTHALVTTDIQKDLKGWIEINGAHDYKKLNIEAIKMFKKIGDEEVEKENNLEFWETTLERINEMDTLALTIADEGFLNSTGFEAERYIDSISTDTSVFNLPYYLGAPGLSLASYSSNLFGNPILNEDSKNSPMTERLGEIEIPSLFLWGKYDFVVPPALGIDAFNRVGTEEKELIIYEYSGHSPMVNQAIPFTNDMINFVEKYR